LNNEKKIAQLEAEIDRLKSEEKTISHQNKIQKDLLESELKHRTLINNIPGMVYRAYPDWSAEIISGSELISGYTVEEISSLDENWLSLIHPDDRERVYQEGNELTKTPKSIVQVYRIIDKNNEIRWVEDRKTSLFKNGNFKGIDGIVFDISERILAEKRVNDALKHYQVLSDASPIGIIMVRDTKFLFVNPSYLKMLGYQSEDELVGQDITIVQPAEQAKQIVKRIRKRAVGGDEPLNYEGIVIKKDGSKLIVQTDIVRINQPDGIATLAFVRDITEKKKSEEELIASEERSRNFIDASPLGIAVLQNYKIQVANPSYAKIYGYTSPSESIGKPMKIVIPHEFRDSVAERGSRRWSGVQEPEAYDTIGLRKDGTKFPISAYAVRIDFKGKPATLAFVGDITNQKKLEAEIIKSQKLESLGILAGGIAHDFNNLLTGISANISLARFSMDNIKELEDCLFEAQNSTIRATKLTNQLLTFSRGGAPNLEKIVINQKIEETCNFTLQGSEVRPTYNLSDDLWSVKVDTGQIDQVLQNIVNNAVQSMPKGGSLIITASNSIINEDTGLNNLKPGNYISITIIDSGVGIPNEDLHKVFDPFFTTKQLGSGLGLSVCYSIIKKHNGFINIQSEVGVGTTVEIFLPALKTEFKLEEDVTDVEITHDSINSKKILVMDDDLSIQKISRKILKKLGHRVVLASDGDEAIAKYKRANKSKYKIDLVILDLTISGGKGGKDTINQLQKIDPNVQAIVSSGYSNDPGMSNFREYGFLGRLTKPYTYEEMKIAINQIFEK
jgi:PAS domain S-box-containing protein